VLRKSAPGKELSAAAAESNVQGVSESSLRHEVPCWDIGWLIRVSQDVSVVPKNAFTPDIVDKFYL